MTRERTPSYCCLWQRGIITELMLMGKKETEIQPGFEPGSSKLWSDALTTDLPVGAPAFEQS